MSTAPVLALLTIELLALHRGQRRLFWILGGGGRLRPLALLALMPGTVVHEAAHWLACRLLGVRVGRVRLFWPRRAAGGVLVLGGVEHARTGPVRGAAISMAPLLLVPAALGLATVGLLGTDDPARLPGAVVHASPPALAAWCLLCLSGGQAAFPSPGDRIGVGGAAGLLLLAAAAAGLVVALAAGGASALLAALAVLATLLAPPAAAATLALVAARLLG